MRIIVALGHPAHFHLFKNFIRRFEKDGNEVKIVITDKDILKSLLIANGFQFECIAIRKKNESFIDKGLKIIKSSIVLKKIIRSYKPEFIIGGLTQIAFASLFTKCKSFFVGEDDITYTLLQGIITYPFVSKIIAPDLTNVGLFKYKKISYKGFQKLAYLHPNVFKKDYNCISPVNASETFFLIRLVSLKAYHDIKAGGFTEPVLDSLIEKLEKFGTVYISSENELIEKYLKYKIPIHINHIHQLMSFAKLYIGDSQSMAVEASMLGTPSIRFNNFSGRISVLEELEHKYGLTFGINSADTIKLFDKVEELLGKPNLQFEFQERKNLMLRDKIDVTAFFVRLFENYNSKKNLEY